VKREFREISDVVNTEITKGAKDFIILFRDVEKNSIVSYKYEAQTPFEAAEIVAKIEFIRKNKKL
jgi:hypothetical protein